VEEQKAEERNVEERKTEERKVESGRVEERPFRAASATLKGGASAPALVILSGASSTEATICNAKAKQSAIILTDC
jgi:hypothetical protein